MAAAHHRLSAAPRNAQDPARIGTKSSSPGKGETIMSIDTRRLVAYKNDRFLESSAARSVRILSEYLEPLDHFRREKIHDTIVFFGSARIAEEGPLGHYYRDARELARRITTCSDGRVHTTCRFVVCRGAGPGSME